MKKFKIKIERFENIIEILPSFYWHRKPFREWYNKGNFVIAWLKWGIVIYIEK
jgi:hypothetical protein